MDLQPAAKGGKIWLSRVPFGSIDREPRGDVHMGAGAQKLQRRLEANLDSTARDEGMVPVETCGLPAFFIVEVAARIAHRVVIAMHLGERFLANVTVSFPSQLRRIAGVLCLRPLQPKRRIYRRAALDP